MHHKIILLISLLLFSGAIFANNANTREFSIQNRSGYSIHVWVVKAKNVEVPGANSFPVKVLVVKPNSTAKLRYAHTNVWNDETRLGLEFCTTPSQACLDTVGEYSAFSMGADPAVARNWQVKQVWSGIVFPYQVSDNIYTFNKMKWPRGSGFPKKIIFKGKGGSRKKKSSR